MTTSRIGELAFLVFVIIAIIAGLVNAFAPFDTFWVTAVLLILGIIVGFLNITEKETTAFLVAAIALLLAGTANFETLTVPGQIVADILGFIGAFVAPAAVIVGLKAIYSLGKKK